MKLVKQKILYFNEGNSDKVYEVDLCESGSDLFVVNFRYGRRGAALREGTKTVFPVAYDEALGIFEKLVLSKEKKGYSESLEEKVVPQEEAATPPAENTAREKTILSYLEKGAAGTYTRNWKISKVILRAGVLNIEKAASLIHPFITSSDEFEQYAAIKVLAQFKDTTCVNDIYAVYRNKGFANKVGRIAAAYLLKFQLNNYHTEIIRDAKQKLPGNINGKLQSNDELLGALALHYMQDKDVDPMLLYYLYLISFEEKSIKSGLLEFIGNVRFRVNTFKSVRYVFRAADLLDESDFYAVIAKKISVGPAGHHSTYVYSDGQWVWVSEEMKKPNPSVAFSNKTQGYFIRNIYKYVYHLSRENIDRYIEMATLLLCQLDNTKDKVFPETKYDWFYNRETRNYDRTNKHYPRYSKFAAIMYILHGNSQRFETNGSRWYYSGDFIPDNELPREEVLQEEWNKRPVEVLRILANSKSEEATGFSLRILEENPEFLNQATGDLLIQLVCHQSPYVVELVLNYLQDKYKDEQAPEDLVMALFKSGNEEAVELVKNWLAAHETSYFSEKSFIQKLLLSGSLPAIEALKERYANELKYRHEFAFSDIEPLLEGAVYSDEYLIAVANLMGQEYFGRLFEKLTVPEILDALENEKETSILIIANLCKQKPQFVFDIFKDKVDAYIGSENPDIRKLGIELLGQFPDSFLKENSRRIGGYYFSEYAEVRTAIQPAISRLVKLDANFKQGILNRSLGALSEAEAYEGLHESIYNLLNKEYSFDLQALSTDEVLDLLNTPYEYAQRIATPLFRQLTGLPNFTVEQLVKIAKSDVREVRDFLPGFFENNVSRINYELEGALRIFNSEWKDVFDWSFGYFEQHINAKNWTVDILLYVCDHVKENVQAFGRKMVTQHFTNDKGMDLLMMLQEHPSGGMQFFATNYLDNYAKDKPEVILKLKDFFKTVFFNINTGRSTKTRVFAFLEQEMVKNESVALMVVDLVNDILTTQILTDQNQCIDMLLTVSETWPHISIPITINEV